jgi:hypothetical protein
VKVVKTWLSTRLDAALVSRLQKEQKQLQVHTSHD